MVVIISENLLLFFNSQQFFFNFFVGSLNDAGVFYHSDIRRAILDGILQFPRKIIRGTGITRLFFIEDAGFGLEDFLLVPFSRMRNLLPEMRLFNYRHSRARRVIECAFGLLKLRWRAFDKPLGFSVRNCEIVIGATLCLHNYLITHEMNEPVENRRYLLHPDEIEIEDDAQEFPVDDMNGNMNGRALRNALIAYFVGIGEIDWQYDAFEYILFSFYHAIFCVIHSIRI